MAKEIVARGGERTRVLHRFSSSLSQTFTFDVEPLVDGGIVNGNVEVHGSRWLFSKQPVVFPLEPITHVDKSFWDSRYSVYFAPDQDVKVTLRATRLR